MMKGYFFAFEGIDGCGKSTQVSLLNDKLVKQGYNVDFTREPGGTVISEKIRQILIDPLHGEMVDECEILLYLASRAQHVRQRIIPALERGKIVLCDRFQLATFAYQGFGRDFPLDKMEQLNAFATGGCAPDLTFVFDIPVEEAFKRMHRMNKLKDRLESSGDAFFHRIHKGYLELGRKNPKNVIIINAQRGVEEIHEEVMEKINPYISITK
ncbi:MAG TPA: dTMP kinase [Chitinispirillaceae bacterium]|nr:dTMP kinase [Chitinispirillaceae bacterium]